MGNPYNWFQVYVWLVGFALLFPLGLIVLGLDIGVLGCVLGNPSVVWQTWTWVILTTGKLKGSESAPTKLMARLSTTLLSCCHQAKRLVNSGNESWARGWNWAKRDFLAVESLLFINKKQYCFPPEFQPWCTDHVLFCCMHDCVWVVWHPSIGCHMYMPGAVQ